ncbi:hypothetical protein N8940_01580 [Sphingomonadaceae bacterium]|nr:hypothetical protein [Sphingomonadaceae bacterium]
MIGNSLKAVTAAVLITFAVPAFAEPTDEQMEANAKAQELGRQIYLHDQAAWHGTDALFGEIKAEDHPELRGYVVDTSASQNLDLVFYAEDEEGLYEFATYNVDGSDIISGGLVDSDGRVPLPEALQKLAAARDAAIEEVAKREWGLCTNSTPNFIMLPPDADGNIGVYVLTSTTEQGVYPFGGHYRVDIAADGSVASARKFTNSCLNLGLQNGPNGEAPVAMGVTHILDDQPTEIHYFQSYYIPAKLMVILPDDNWEIEKGTFTGLIDLDQ